MVTSTRSRLEEPGTLIQNDRSLPNSIHVWYIYLHLPHILPLKTTIHVGKYTVRPMEGMGSSTKQIHVTGVAPQG